MANELAQFQSRIEAERVMRRVNILAGGEYDPYLEQCTVLRDSMAHVLTVTRSEEHQGWWAVLVTEYPVESDYKVYT